MAQQGTPSVFTGEPGRSLPEWASHALQGVPLDQCQALLSSATVFNVAPGVVLCGPADPPRLVFFIVRGTIRLQHTTGTSDVAFGLLGPGDLAGETAALDGTAGAATIMTVEHAELVAVSSAAFVQAIERVPRLAANVARLLATQVRRAQSMIVRLTSMEVDRRVALLLLDFAERYGRETADGRIRLALRLTQQDLASLVGASRERTNRALVAFRRRGWIAVERECHMTIMRPDLLAKRARSTY